MIECRWDKNMEGWAIILGEIRRSESDDYNGGKYNCIFTETRLVCITNGQILVVGGGG